jgi:hypothetical protein
MAVATLPSPLYATGQLPGRAHRAPGHDARFRRDDDGGHGGTPSHALSGAALFLLFTCGVVSQLATTRLPASRVLALGTISMLVGLLLLVVSVRPSTPSLALFLIAGALIGAGSGAVFKGTTGIVLEASPQSRVAMPSDLLIALYVGLAVPVIGAGVALDLGASAPDSVLGFAILVGLGVVISGWALLRRRP